MNQFTFLHIRGFTAPFTADDRCRGSINDANGKLVPVLVLPSVESDACRLTLARAIADNLNREAADFFGKRPRSAA